jgi:hypothetical protein
MMMRTWVHAGALQLIFLFKCLEYTTGMYIHAYNGCKTSEIVKERCSLKSQELQTLCQAWYPLISSVSYKDCDSKCNLSFYICVHWCVSAYSFWNNDQDGSILRIGLVCLI